MSGVIDAHLKKQGTKYILGDKLSYVDLLWVPWFGLLAFAFPEWDYKPELPHFAAWIGELQQRKSVITIKEHRDFNGSH